MAGKVTQIHKLVESALQKWEETRDSDKKLILAVWYLQNPNYEQDFRKFFLGQGANPETIRRIRQKLQEQGKYLGSKLVEEARFDKFKDMRNTKYASVSFIDDILN
jgi:hypothetical protein